MLFSEIKSNVNFSVLNKSDLEEILTLFCLKFNVIISFPSYKDVK